MLRWSMVIGTLGYVMSELEDGKPFSQVVKAAKSLGFTEPGLILLLLIYSLELLFQMLVEFLLMGEFKT